MLEPPKSALDYEEQEKERQRQIRENGGVTDWGQTAEAIDILKSPLATPQPGAPVDAEQKKLKK